MTASSPTGHSHPAFPIATEIRATCAGHRERRARTLIEHAMAEDAAFAHAADEAILFARPPAQLARRGRALVELVDAYDGSTYRLLRDLGAHLNLSLAYVDRTTIEAHLERTLSDGEWAATTTQFTALDFDDHVGDHGKFRTDWIEGLLERAGVRGYTADGDSPDTTRRPEPQRMTTTAGGEPR